MWLLLSGFSTPIEENLASGRASRGKPPWHAPCYCLLSKEAVTMIAGVVTTKHVLLHSAAIVHGFGFRTWLHCCKAILTNRRTTFLELVWQP
jgi:hypothetical protein